MESKKRRRSQEAFKRSRRNIENRALLSDIRCALAESGWCYGVRASMLSCATGRCVGRHRVPRLMWFAGLRGRDPASGADERQPA